MSLGNRDPASRTRRLFISYHREDSPGASGRLYDRLVAHYGRHEVFMDMSPMPFGANQVQHMLGAVKSSSLLLVIVGEKWLRTTSDTARDAADLSDIVHAEIGAALEQGVPVLPVILDQSPIPAHDLPHALALLSLLNPVRVDIGRDFHRDVDRLVGAIDSQLESARLNAQPRVASPVADTESTLPLVAVLGSSTANLSTYLQALCVAVGRAILERGLTLIVEERGAIAGNVLAGARDFLLERLLAEAEWVRRVPEFLVADDGSVSLGTDSSENSPVRAAVLLIAGGRRAERIADAARLRGMTILPIGISGGAAKQLWLETRPLLGRAYGGVVGEAEFASLNQAGEPSALAAAAVNLAVRLSESRLFPDKHAPL